MAALGDALTEEFAVDGVAVAVVGMLSGRDPSAMLAPLAAGRRRPRSLPASPTRRAPCRSPRWPRRRARSGWRVYEEPDVRDALRVARGMVDADGLVVVAGSLYVVGTARADALASAVPWEEAGR